MIRGILRAMFGLRNEPSTDQGLVFTLLENGRTETMALGGWIVAWAITAATLIVSGQVAHSWSQPLRMQVVTIAAILMAISAAGVLIRVIRASAALSSGRKLAVKQRPASGYDRGVARLTMPTPWVLLPQVLLGIAFGLLGGSQAIYA